jgi:hypothetical protein
MRKKARAPTVLPDPTSEFASFAALNKDLYHLRPTPVPGLDDTTDSPRIKQVSSGRNHLLVLVHTICHLMTPTPFIL